LFFVMCMLWFDSVGVVVVVVVVVADVVDVLRVVNGVVVVQ